MTSMTRTRSTSGATRSRAVDVARGLAVTGVVFNHAVDGLFGSGLIGEGSAVAVVNDALYLFRMPALVFVLALFIPGGVAKRGATGYVRTRVSLMVYLYLVWFVVQNLVEIATSSVKNTPRGWGSLLLVWLPPAHLWFLPFLAVLSTVMALARPWRPTPAGRTWALVLVAAGVLGWGANSPVAGLTGLSLVVFAVAGAKVGLRRMSRLMAGPLWAWAAAVTLAGVCFLVLVRGAKLEPATRGTPSDLGTHVLSVLAAALGVVVLLGVATFLARVGGQAAEVVALVGRHTLAIYLAHVTVVAGLRIVLVTLGVREPWVLLVVAVPLGVAAPLALDLLSARLRLGWLFQRPRWLSDRVERDAAFSQPPASTPGRRSRPNLPR